MSALPILALVADLAAAFWSVVLLRRLRDWLLVFFAALPTLLAGHQILMMANPARQASGSSLHLGEDLSGLSVSVLVLLAVVFAGRSLAERQSSQRALRVEKAYLEQLLASLPEAIVLLDNREVVLRVNPEFETLFGYREDEAVGEQINDLIAPEDQRDEASALSFRVARGETIHFETVRRHKCGELVQVSILGTPIHTEAGQVAIFGIYRDITVRKLAEQQLRDAALHDGLTGLPNRAQFSETLKRAFARCAHDPTYRFAVLFLDLDRFKMVNDSLGHLAGDRVLQAVGRRLRSSLREGDAVARLAGDEFTVFLGRVSHEDGAVAIAERIQETLRRPFEVDGQEVVLTAGVGIVPDGARYRSAEEILRDADLAMYRTKAEGGGVCRVFDPAMHAEAVARLELETDLRRSIERDELTVLYQPIIDLDSGRIAGFEALARWDSPSRGMVLPGEFIGAAEETGLIVELGDRVLVEACTWLAGWAARFGEDAPFVSVNLSARQFRRKDFLRRMLEVVESSGLTAERFDLLNLEITESALMDGAERYVEMVSELRERGIGVHIDDFGTGYSSLSYLHRFAVQALKIDRSFVAGMGAGTGNREIVESMITLASNLGIDVIAEGVETAEQEELLRRMHCPLAQGFYFSHAVTAGEAEELLGAAALRRSAR